MFSCVVSKAHQLSQEVLLRTQALQEFSLLANPVYRKLHAQKKTEMRHFEIYKFTLLLTV